MEFILLFIPLVLLFFAAAAVSHRIGYSIEQSNLIVICATTLLIILFGLTGILNIGFYILIAAFIASFTYLVIRKVNLLQYFTPGMVGYFVAVAIFIVLSRGCQLFDHDDVVHWSYATKFMYTGGTFYKGLQAMFLPSFNFFITKSSFHFVESSLFVGSWMFIWSCFILPLFKTGWNHWKRVLLYMAAVYCLFGWNYGNIRLRIDEMMGFMAGAMIAYYAILQKRSSKDYILVIIGLLALSQMKDGFGAVTSMLTALCIITIDFVVHFKNLKKNLIHNAIFFITPIAGYGLSTLTIDKPTGYLPTENIYNMPIIQRVIESKVTIALLIISIFVLIFLLYTLINNEKRWTLFGRSIALYKITAILAIMIFGVTAYRISALFLSTFSYSGRDAFIKAWEQFFYLSSSGRNNKQLLGLVALAVGFIGVYAIKKDYKTQYTSQSIAIYSAVFVYALMVLVAFSAGMYRSGQYAESVSWERYLSVPPLMLLTYLLGYSLLSEGHYEKDRYARIFVSLAAVAIVANYVPHPGIIANSKAEPGRFGPSSFVEKYQDHSDIINAYVEKDASVYIVTLPASDDPEVRSYGYYPSIYIKYATTPRPSSWLYDGDGAKDTLDDHIHALSQYDYVYIQSTGNAYYELFGSLYPQDHYQDYVLYRVNPGQLPLLSEVYVDPKTTLIE